MRHALYFAALLMLVVTTASAQGLKSEDEMKSLTESVMKAVSAGDLKGAFEKMKPYVLIAEAEFEAAALQSRAQRDQFMERFQKFPVPASGEGDEGDAAF